MELAKRYNVIDVDSHVIEPKDLWTSRVSKKWGDKVPHVVTSSRTGVERWVMGDVRLSATAGLAHAGWGDFVPSHPKTLDEADPGSWRAGDRLKWMDRHGVYAQVLYPNLLGFQSEAFMKQSDYELGLECIRAYNDFIAEFCSIDRDRLIPMMWVPFWDVEASLAEMNRAARLGHKGLIFGGDFAAVGLPKIGDEHWHPLMAAAQDLDLSVNFHIGFTDPVAGDIFQRGIKERSLFIQVSSNLFMGNGETISEVILSGLCERFPRLRFVSVESGAGWLPFFVESMDWQWKNSGGHKVYPGRLLPSEYFRRQVYGSFWFESATLKNALELFPDNFMFETDYPHPTSLSPGPGSFAQSAATVVDEAMKGLSEDLVRKVLHDNAARLYGLSSPALRDTRVPA